MSATELYIVVITYAVLTTSAYLGWLHSSSHPFSSPRRCLKPSLPSPGATLAKTAMHNSGLEKPLLLTQHPRRGLLSKAFGSRASIAAVLVG